MSAHRSVVRVGSTTALLACLASASPAMDGPLGIVFVHAQGQAGGNDSIWIDVGSPVLTAADGRRYAMGVVRLNLAELNVIVYRAVEGAVTLDGQTLVALTVELVRVDGGFEGGETATLVVRPDPDAASGNLRFEVQGGRLNLSGEATGSVLVQFVADGMPNN